MPDDRDELLAQIRDLQDRLDVLEGARATPPAAPPTLEALRAEIESGPLASELAPLWVTVFGPHPTKRKQLRYREGWLTPDAAHAIHRILTTGSPSRAEVLGWGNDWPFKLVSDAKKLKGGASLP